MQWKKQVTLCDPIWQCGDFDYDLLHPLYFTFKDLVCFEGHGCQRFKNFQESITIMYIV